MIIKTSHILTRTFTRVNRIDAEIILNAAEYCVVSALQEKSSGLLLTMLSFKSNSSGNRVVVMNWVKTFIMFLEWILQNVALGLNV